MSNGVTQIPRGAEGREERRTSRVWIRTAVELFTLYHRNQKEPEEPRAGRAERPVNPRNPPHTPTPQTRCQATRSICVNWEYRERERERRDGALLIIESVNGSPG